MKKAFACAVRPNKAPSMHRGLSIISLEHSYGLNGSRIFDRTQLAPKCSEKDTFLLEIINEYHEQRCRSNFSVCFYNMMALNLFFINLLEIPFVDLSTNLLVAKEITVMPVRLPRFFLKFKL